MVYLQITKVFKKAEDGSRKTEVGRKNNLRTSDFRLWTN
jgi:hypothetical protein